MNIRQNPVSPKFSASVRRRMVKEGGVAESYKDIVLLEGARTPFAKLGGSYKDLSAYDLFHIAGKAALEKAGVKPEHISQAIVGQIVPNDIQASYVARGVERDLGIPVNTLALNINRLCGTGFEAVRQAAMNLTNGGDSAILTGGVEVMSRAPWMDNESMLLARQAQELARKGETDKAQKLMDAIKLRSPQDLAPLTKGLTDPIDEMVMFQMADNVAKTYGVTRADADKFAVESHKRAALAQALGRFDDEMVPVTQEALEALKATRTGAQSNIKTGTLPPGVKAVLRDEHVRPDSTLESVSKQKVLDQNCADAVTTAATSSGVVDGAAAMVVSTGKFAKAKHLNVLARLKAVAVVGCEPKILGISPASAIEEALKSARVSLDKVDIIEVNEAFAPQAYAVAKLLSERNNYSLDKLLAKFNPDGGAVAIGHPLAASGTRISMHAAYRLRQSNKQYAVVSACIGGGQGIALVLENPDYKKRLNIKG